MNQAIFDDLFYAYLNDTCSDQELASLLEIIQDPENRDWIRDRIRSQLSENPSGHPLTEDRLSALEKSLDLNLERIFQRIDEHAATTDQPPAPAGQKRGRLLTGLKWFAGAAAVTLLFAGIFWWNRAPAPSQVSPQATAQRGDFTPGKNAAVLTVEGGEQIYLDSKSRGSIARQGSSLITSANGQISYTANRATAQVVYNTLTTSNGNQYSLVLPDGTRVWLNAASSIRYPVAFTGATREVEASGELYFEVKHNDKQPFIVKAGGQVIEDLGTAFNVHAYANEKTFTTTLVEGAVKIGGNILQPGDQAKVISGNLSIHEVDTTQVVAWKNGLFSFHQTPVKEVMRQIARWYDVTVAYQGPVPDLRFGGKISRNSNASVVLTILEKSGLNFKVEGRQITVTGSREP